MKNPILLLMIVCLAVQCNLKKIDDEIAAAGPTALFTVDKTNGDAPCNIVITNTSENATNFAWNFGDNTSSTDDNPVPHLYANPGNYTIRLIATGEKNLKDTFSISIAVVAAGVKPVAAFSVGNNGCLADCNISFTNTTTNGATYLWNFGDPESGANNTSTEISTSHTYSMPGSYAVKLIATNGAQKDSTTQNVTINGIKFQNPAASNGALAKIKQISDGGYIGTGTTNNTVYIVRLDANGNVLKNQTYPFSNAEVANDIIQLSDGTFVVVGVSYNAAISNTDCFYLRVDANLDPITGPTRIGENNRSDEARSVLELTDGSVLMTGYSTNTASGNTDVYVLRYSPQLTTEYFKKVVTAPNLEVGTDAVQISSGYMITGYINYSSGATASNALLLQLDQNGNTVSGFPKTIGGSGDESALAMAKISDSEFIIAGFTTGNELDVYLQKVNISGNTVGSPITISKAGNAYAYDIDIDHSGNYVVTGQSSLDAFFAKISPAGAILNDKPYVVNGDDAFYSIQPTTDGGFIMGGYKSSSWYFIKTDKDGTFN